MIARKPRNPAVSCGGLRGTAGERGGTEKRSALKSLSRTLPAFNLALEIPDRLHKILSAAFQIRAPDIFHGVAETEIHVLGDLNALHAGRVLSVMRGMIDAI